MRRAALLALTLLLPATAPAQGLSIADILGRATELTLQDAILLALEHNLNLVVARTDPAVADEVRRQAQGAYDPQFTASTAYEDTEEPRTNSIETAFGTPSKLTLSEALNHNASLSGVLPLGLRYRSAYNFRRTESNSFFFSLSPDWRVSWDNELTLPLLRNLIHNEVDVLVKRSRIAQGISEDDFRRQLINEIQAVEAAYWDLAAAVGGRAVAEKSLEAARDLLEQTRVQYEVGVVSRVAVTQAEAGVAEREVNEIVARNTAELAHDTLLNLILAPGLQGYSDTTLIPEDPTYLEFEIDVEAAVERAMETRPELAVARQQVEDAELQLALANNQKLPAFDVTASYSLDGASGSPKPQVVPQVPESGADSHHGFFHSDGAHSWSVTANFQIPLPNTTARALAVQRKIELRRRRTDLRRVEQQVILEARKGARDLRSALDGIKATERRQAAAAEALRAEQEKLRLGDSTPHDVLEFEEDLAEAEDGVINALKVYRNAVTQLEKAQGTLLESRRISVDSELGR